MKQTSAYDAWKKCKYPERTVLVVSKGKNGKENIITVGWNMPTSNDPSLLAISIGLTRFSHKLIDEGGEFVVSFPSEGMEKAVLYCGTYSGRYVDKFKETGLTKVPSSCIMPSLIKEAVVNMECKVVDKIKTGDHTIFIGKVLVSHVSEEDKKPITNLGGGRFGSV